MLHKYGNAVRAKKRPKVIKDIINSKYLLLMFLPAFLYYIIFCYFPMYGLVTAFQDYIPGSGPNAGFINSEFVGFKHFIRFFDSPFFFRTLKNTLLIGFYTVIWCFPIPIMFALFLNEIGEGFLKKFLQSASYLPRFISMVVAVGIVTSFLDPYNGVVNNLLAALGVEQVNFLLEAKYFRTIYIVSEIWQYYGWNSIIYLAALSSIDPTLYEAADIDGATRTQKMRYITLPGIQTTIIILLVLTLGGVMNLGFEKILLLYNQTTYDTADVIQTYIYRVGLMNFNFSYASAVGLFNSVCNFILLVVFNKLSKKFTGTSVY